MAPQATRAKLHISAIEDAIWEAVYVAAELPGDHVRWKYKNTNQPPDPYIDLGIGSSFNPGQDGLKATTDLTRPRGKEIELRVVGVRQIVLQMEAWTTPTSSDAEEGEDAIALLEQVKTAMILPGFKERLRRVGAAVLDRSDPVNFVPSIVRANFRGRATFDCRVSVPPIPVREFVGYIERVSGTIQVGLTGPDEPIAIPFNQPGVDEG